MKRKITKLLVSTLSVCTLLAGCTTKESKNSTSNNTSNNSETLAKYENVSSDVGFDTIYSYMEYTTNTDSAATHLRTALSYFVITTNYLIFITTTMVSIT